MVLTRRTGISSGAALMAKNIQKSAAVAARLLPHMAMWLRRKQNGTSGYTQKFHAALRHIRKYITRELRQNVSTTKS